MKIHFRVNFVIKGLVRTLEIVIARIKQDVTQILIMKIHEVHPNELSSLWEEILYEKVEKYM